MEACQRCNSVNLNLGPPFWCFPSSERVTKTFSCIQCKTGHLAT